MSKGNGRTLMILVLGLTLLAVAPKGSFAGGLIISGDNVGIGTGSPGYPLDVQSGGTAIYGGSSSGYGVFGYSTSGTGVSGTSSTSGDGVSGTSATGNGLRGSSSSGSGVYGSSTSNYGVRGESASGTGVSGTSFTSGTGVYGSSSSGIGIYGYSTSGNAGYFQGLVHVTGNQTVGGSVTAASFSGSISPTNITSGIAGIDISGNAATVTNGVYTTGSYANPSWITSMAGSKITGDISGNAATATTATTATTANSVAAGAVSTGGLAYGAVTPEKIAFYGNVAIVAPSGGDYDNPATAMSDYASWCPTPESDTPCLLKIMPGVYDVGSSPVVMHVYIDIEGSGEKTTNITGAVNSSPYGTVVGKTNAEIRFLTVTNTTAGGVAIHNINASPKLTHVTAISNSITGDNYAVENKDYSSPTMTDVTAIATGGSSSNVKYAVQNYNNCSPTMTNVTAIASGPGNNYGVKNYNSSPTMTNVTATGQVGNTNYGVSNSSSSSPTMTNVIATATGGTGSNFGVWNSSSPSLTMTNVTATATGGSANYGVYSSSSTVRINHSVIKGSTNTIANFTGTTLVGNTQLDGGPVSGTGTIICAGVYDENYTFYADMCP